MIINKTFSLQWSLTIGLITMIILLIQVSASPSPYYPNWFNFNLGAPGEINQNGAGCETAGFPCSGHTLQSCQSYCKSVGYPFGSCEGSCCLCTHTDLNFPGTGIQQFLNPTQMQIPIPSVGTNIIPFRSNSNPSRKNISSLDPINPQPTSSLDWELEAQESSRVIHKEYYSKNSLKRQWNKPKIQVEKPNRHQFVCQSNACQGAATQLLENMNPKANPCDNFYEFACGGFLQKTQIPSDKAEVTVFTALRDKVSIQLKVLFEEPLKGREPKPFHLIKNLYKSCMNTVVIEKLGMKPVKEVIAKLGGWPVLEGNQWQSNYKTWSNFIVWFRELGFSHDYFMKISVEPDIKNINKRHITIGEPALGLTREVLLRGGKEEPSVNAYYKYMVETAVLLGASRSVAQKEMLETLNFEIQLAKIIYKPENSRGTAFYSPTTIASLEQQYPTVPWLDLFKRLLPKKIRIDSQEVIMVSVPHYVQAFVNLAAHTDIRVLSNYAIWRMVASSMNYLPETARNLQFDFFASITGQRQRVPRWKSCTDLVSTSLGNAAGAMYIRRYFNAQSKGDATEMIRDIQQAFLQILDEIDWMDPQTKAQAKNKARNIRIHVGYPEEHLTDPKITALYSEYDFKDNDYFGNARNLIIAATNLALESLKSPVDKNDWVVHGKNAVVNAFYIPLENAMQFPAAILQNPFFDSARPKYMNYGAIGWITGHELSHGFDDLGHQFDQNGNLADWWDPFTKKTFKTKTQCIINQYGKFSPSGLEIKLNGVNSQGENVADNGGIKQAYRGYQSWVKRSGAEKTLPGFESYTPNQLFWLSAANNWCSVHRAESLRNQILGGVHSPGEFRVRGTFANNPDFSIDFHCPVGSQMNSVKKCSVW